MDHIEQNRLVMYLRRHGEPVTTSQDGDLPWYCVTIPKGLGQAVGLRVDMFGIYKPFEMR